MDSDSWYDTHNQYISDDYWQYREVWYGVPYNAPTVRQVRLHLMQRDDESYEMSGDPR